MQQGSRSAFDLFARDLRMAGYGVDLTMPGVPAPLAYESATVLDFNGNYSNVKTSGSGIGSTITVASTTGFAPNNYAVIRSFLGGECVAITSVGATTIQLQTPLTHVYPAGSAVSQIETLRYQLTQPTLLRNTTPMVDAFDQLNMTYYLHNGTTVTDPATSIGDVRTAQVTLQTKTINQPTNKPNEKMSVQGEVRIRNLGLYEVVRTP
jgi:Tfp pilus assembly protein PilW